MREHGAFFKLLFTCAPNCRGSGSKGLFLRFFFVTSPNSKRNISNYE